MAWTSPRTWVANEFVTAALLNTHVRDNLNALRDILLGVQDLGANWKISSNRVLKFQNSAVAHGMTTLTETDTFGLLQASSATEGGLTVEGFADVDRDGVSIVGINGSATPTLSGVLLYGAKKNGTGVQAFGASEKVFRFQNLGSDLGVWYGSGGLNIVGGLAVGYTGVPVGGAITVGDSQFKFYVAGGVSPTIEFDAADGSGIAYHRTSDQFSFQVAGANTRLIIRGDAVIPNACGLQIATTGYGGYAVAPGTINFEERADPAASQANACQLYAKDNGAGKTQLVAIFATGAVQVIVTQP